MPVTSHDVAHVVRRRSLRVHAAVAPRIVLFGHQHVERAVLRQQADRLAVLHALLAAGAMLFAVLAELDVAREIDDLADHGDRLCRAAACCPRPAAVVVVVQGSAASCPGSPWACRRCRSPPSSPDAESPAFERRLFGAALGASFFSCAAIAIAADAACSRFRLTISTSCNVSQVSMVALSALLSHSARRTI